MYPYFTLRWHKLFAVGIWIVISVFVFIFVAWYHAKKQKIQFTKLFFWLPTLLISTYLLWKWAGLAFEADIWFPLRSFKTLGSWLSPYGYNFHFIGVALGGAFAWRKFYKKIFLKTEKYKWVDVMFYALSASLIPLGLFLLLGDNFMWKPTEARYWVSALLNDSAWTQYGSVIPIWIFVSIIWFISYWIVLILSRFSDRPKVWWYLWFSMIFLWMCLVFLLQFYARRGVVQFLGFTRDIKNYLALLLALVFFFQFMRTIKKR